MNINGIGSIFGRGVGIDCYESALKQRWQAPVEVDIAGLKPDRTLLKKMRRSDKFSKMSVLAAADALKNSGIENINKNRIGIIVATAFGAHVTTFNFLDDILDYGEAGVSPTKFSNSVHNAAASYISSSLDISGPTLTITRFDFPFQYALQLAQIWLNEGRCEYVLTGAVEQYGHVMGYIYGQKLVPADDGRIMPFNFKPTFQVPGEGAAFFLLSKKASGNIFCEVENIQFSEMSDRKLSVDLNIIDADGTLADESDYKAAVSPDTPTAAYSPLFGSMTVGSAFNCAAGALMLKNQMYYANPVTDNPHGLNLLSETKCSDIELIRCIRYNCQREKAVIMLQSLRCC